MPFLIFLCEEIALSDRWTHLDTDVLVVGGGVAGCMAAIPALEAGLDVVVCEKGKVLDHCVRANSFSLRNSVETTDWVRFWTFRPG